ncbi:hypothetical protein RBB77_01595 [Tunturibacter psychrotolerans]|uniref:Uncharacterized protein n=1 Tax=Tunturiibacter psychrotolerans TaxID=3069686 RepID=A0AAU7ZRG5_9BACT
MPTSTASSDTASTAQVNTCLPCDIPAFCRNSYYRGKLLTERDFRDEQRYGIDKMRLHTLALHGWGVVCGLVVKPHPYCPEKRLMVCEGLAIDDCGREIRLLCEDYVLLPQPPPMASQPARRQEDKDDDPATPDDGCDPAPVPSDLYLCIRYAECETEYAPAPFDDCSCSTSSQKPNRVCEGYTLELYQQKPSFWDNATHEPCPPGNCIDYYRKARECCPPASSFPCLPLAVICNFVPGQAVKPEQIENWAPRRQLVSTDTLDQVIRCILTKLPTEELTRIEDTNWEHNRRMLCREFMEEYVGTPEHPRGFRIEFSHKVRSAEIDTRSFQALVVFRPENESEPRQMQIAPARVEREPDETIWARLHIDPNYARRHLDGRSFDLFLILKCDVIRDLDGHALDGNFIGHKLPTGDNIQGGIFESWVRIRPRSRNY